jgi:Peptidase family M23
MRRLFLSSFLLCVASGAAIAKDQCRSVPMKSGELTPVSAAEGKKAQYVLVTSDQDEVRALTDGTVVVVLHLPQTDCEAIGMQANGDTAIYYRNLAVASVHKGDHVHKGDLLGKAKEDAATHRKQSRIEIKMFGGPDNGKQLTAPQVAAFIHLADK